MHKHDDHKVLVFRYILHFDSWCINGFDQQYFIVLINICFETYHQCNM